MAGNSRKKIADFFKPRRREIVTVQLDSDDESKPKTDNQRRLHDSKNSSNFEKNNRPGTSTQNETPRSKLQERRLSLEKMRLEVQEQKARERKSRLSLSNFDHSSSESDNESESKASKAPVKDIRHYFRPDSQRHRNRDNSSTSHKQSKPSDRSAKSDKKNRVETVDIESDSSSSSKASDNQARPQETQAQKEISRSKIRERKLLLEKMRQKVLEQKDRERKSRLPIVGIPEPEEPEESSSDEPEATSARSDTSGRSTSAQVVVQDVLHKKREHDRRHHQESTSSKKPRVEEPNPSTSSAHDIRTALRSQNRGRRSPSPNKPVEITFESDTDDEEEDARSDKSHTSEEEQVNRFRSDEVCVLCQSLKTTHKIIRQPWHYDVTWCKCRNCVPKKYMPNYHRICCREISFVVDKLKDELEIENKKHPCVTSHPEFDRQVLQMEALQKIGGVERYRKPGGPKRSEAYISSLSYVQWTMGSVILGMLIPTCVRKKIMDHFPGQKLPVAYAVSRTCSKGIHCKFSMAESFPASSL